MLEYYKIKPCDIEWNDISAAEAFSCSLCSLCAAVCPQELNLADLFWEKRVEAIAEGFVSLDDFNFLFPDTPNFKIKAILKEDEIDYSDLESTSSETAFFPGCLMFAVNPDLTRRAYEVLESQIGPINLITECCGKVLDQFGAIDRRDEFTDDLRKTIKSQGIKRIITSCPNCYYYLTSKMPEAKITFIYQHLSASKIDSSSDREKIISIHDSCPDRFEKLFINSVRELLSRRKYNILEMEHSKKMTLCCGSGGQVRYFDEELVKKKQEKRLAEAKKMDINIVVCYCMSCALKLEPLFRPHGIEVKHALELLLR